MINFKTFLTEARMAPLYHGTDFRKGCSILENGFKPVTIHRKSKLLNLQPGEDTWVAHSNGISTTRSLPFATRWARENAEAEFSYSFMVIELDQQAISQQYKIKPIQYWNGLKAARPMGADHRRNEYEEFIITDKILPPRYIKAVHYFISTKQGRTPSEAMQNAGLLASILGTYQQDMRGVKFIPIKGGEPIS